MRLYVTDSQVPELKLLTPDLRRLVFRRALALMHVRSRLSCWLPVLLCFIGGVAGAFFGAALLGHFHLSRASVSGDWMVQSIVWCYSGVCIGAFSGGFAGLQLRRCRLRPYLRRVIEECGFENTNAT